MAVSAPPKKAATKVITEKKTKDKENEIDKIIKRGGSAASKNLVEEPELIKNFNIKIMSSQLATIDELRTKRPRKPTSPKLGVSLQDWIIEAIEEKIRKERKKYNLGA